MPQHWLDAIKEVGPSAVGSAGALLRIKVQARKALRRLSLFILGCYIGYYIGSYVSHKTGIPESVSGFIVGLFGVACAQKAFELIEKIDFGLFWSLFAEIVKSRWGGK